MRKLCGIDEAGRGCIAGDLAVAGVVLTKKIDGINDSKKLSEIKRDLLSIEIKESAIYHIVLTPSYIIDKIGLSLALKNSILEIKEKIQADKYLMDGNSSFGVEGVDTMVKADTKILEVGAASILAKVARDQKLKNLNSKYNKYEFSSHKGYGTKKHIALIKKYGLSDEHRHSFKLKALE